MPLFNQPFEGQLGGMLISKLHQNYKRLSILSAFAKNSGVLRLKSELTQFRDNGGYIQIFVGVDIQGTTFEALQNLLSLCDALYVVHSEDSATTFHSKVYLLENDKDVWMAVGSNNLTGGGLWTNLESFHCSDYVIGTPNCDEIYKPFISLVGKYLDPEYECSLHITCEEDLIELDRAGYLSREFDQHIKHNENFVKLSTSGHKTIFGKQRRAGLPQIQEKTSRPHAVGEHVRIGKDETVQATHVIEDTDASERIWFETRKLTGGSRNILDLSKTGKLLSGSGLGSRYETSNPNVILGGVAFFDIPPESTNIVKNIVVNYNGIDYEPCTILFAQNNGSWRLQLKGVSEDGEKIHLINGREWLVSKILVFEKINTAYYSLSVLEPDIIKTCQATSYMVAYNGITKGSKLFGLF